MQDKTSFFFTQVTQVCFDDSRNLAAHIKFFLV